MRERINSFFAVALPSLIGLLSPIQELIYATLGFIFIHFIVDVWYKTSMAIKTKSIKPLRRLKVGTTIFHLFASVVIIVMAFVIDEIFLPHERFEFPKIVSAIICCSEFISTINRVAIVTGEQSYKEIKQIFQAIYRKIIPKHTI